MGSGHSHPAHPNHRLRREKCSTQGAMCGLCHRRIELGEMAYRCAAAEHFSGHRLDLTARADGGGVVPAGSSYDVCARSLDGYSHVTAAAPPSADGRRRKCLNVRHRGGGETAWSYRCSACPDVELCLQCAMGRDGDGNGDDTTCLCGGADAGQGAVCAGIVAGKFIKGLMWGMGCGCGTPI
uniref:Uncharacterized protein n=1 Tax=Oryza nivara TaxID=4536 RepID=A0A0E0IF44_ORYNI